MLRSIGADKVVDYVAEDFTERGEAYDVIIDVVGTSPYSGCMRSLKDDGLYILDNAGLSRRLRSSLTLRRHGKQVLGGSAPYMRSDMALLKQLVEAWTLRPVIDRIYTLEEAVEAHRYVDSGQKKGNVVMTVGGHGES